MLLHVCVVELLKMGAKPQVGYVSRNTAQNIVVLFYPKLGGEAIEVIAFKALEISDFLFHRSIYMC